MFLNNKVNPASMSFARKYLKKIFLTALAFPEKKKKFLFHFISLLTLVILLRGKKIKVTKN